MRNTELIEKIYDRLPKMWQNNYTIDQLFDRCMDIQDMIERERPELRDNQKPHHPQQDAGIDY
jgi:hypothetical protein